ncbi:18988_t:CDS:2 [Entrophospora sp. SA101]|nr:18988_t:CDS:2 [Entrophospora sp. SA101]
MNKSVELISGPITFGAQGQRVFNHVDLPVVTNQVSVTFRLKLLSHNPNWTTIFHKGTDDKNLTPGIWMHGERMSAGFATSLVNYIKLTLLPSLSLNKWYHIAYVFSGPGNKLDLYIDEVKDDFKGDKIKELLENNQQWSSENQNNKEFFDKLKKQEPKVLWFGCSDSRVPPELITKSGFGELFVHRNIANQFNPNDANCMSVLQYAVNYLKVSHIVICHTGCGGAKSCFEPGLEPDLEKWLEGIRGLATINPEFSHTNPNFGTPEVQDKLVKANVVKQVEKISKNYFVKSAEQTIQIHGLVFDLKDVHNHFTMEH